MLSMTTSRYVPVEEREQERRALLDDIGALSDSFPPDYLLARVREELQRFDLLPEEPLSGFQFLDYAKQVAGPLSVGYERAWNFAKNWKGRR